MSMRKFSVIVPTLFIILFIVISDRDNVTACIGGGGSGGVGGPGGPVIGGGGGGGFGGGGGGGGVGGGGGGGINGGGEGGSVVIITGSGVRTESPVNNLTSTATQING